MFLATTKRAARNSSFELLRIIAMALIFAHHFVLYNAGDIWEMPLDFKRIFFEVAFLAVGKIGALVFFLITAWYLSEKEQSYRLAFRRVWVMECELLFYSIGTYLAFKFLLPEQIPGGGGYGVRALFPLFGRIWWYPTVYATFLLVMPPLTRGLRSLGEPLHKRLALVCIVLWGIVQGLCPEKTVTNDTLVYFVVVYVLVCYYRWYMKPVGRSTGVLLIVLGMAAIVGSILVLGFLVPGDSGLQMYLTSEWKLPVALVSFGLVLLFSSFRFTSRTVNLLAGSMFGAYLISEHRLIRPLLWEDLLSFEAWYVSPFAPLFAILSILVALGLCISLDWLRRMVFSLVFRRPGALFDRLWEVLVGARRV